MHFLNIYFRRKDIRCFFFRHFVELMPAQTSTVIGLLLRH